MNDHYITPLNDEPIIDEQDLLGRRHLLDVVKHAIAEGKPPQVFGIHGDWGSGKTSFLRQVRYELTGEHVLGPHDDLPAKLKSEAKGYAAANPHVTAIWFEAWRYQNESAPIVALLHEIRSQITWRNHAAAKTKLSAQKYSEVAIRGGLLQMEQVTKMIGFQASKVQEAGETWEREHLAVSLPSDQIRALLDEVLGQLLPKTNKPEWDEKRRLVVFIDDLDRCEAETAFRLLEGIKIYLNLSRCVFVLGLNQRE
ncbi:MAG TPA: P-loop NTPase fold protein, partial [Abditibacteriaceae bacterium]